MTMIDLNKLVDRIKAIAEENKMLKEQLESADSVKVVRCKDCKWWNTETYGCNRNPCVEQWHEDDFCNYGERTEK